MDIITVLKEDHRNVEDLFKQLESSSDRAVKTKEKLFSQLMSELTLHAAAEERILYPLVEQLRDLRSEALEAYEEHRLITQLLAELSAIECGCEQWAAKLKVLKDMIEHHVLEEETEMFNDLKARFPKAELRALGDEVQAYKRTLRGHPLIPPALPRVSAASSSPSSAPSRAASELPVP